MATVEEAEEEAVIAPKLEVEAKLARKSVLGEDPVPELAVDQAAREDKVARAMELRTSLSC